MFAFNRDYDDYGQVRHMQPAYEAHRAMLDGAGRYPYNDSFRGMLGEEFATPRDEESAIYMLQRLHDLDEIERKRAAFIAEGAEEITVLDGPRRFSRVVRYGWFMGGTGWAEFSDVRLVPYGGKAGRPYSALPKGRRTNGFDVSTGTVLALT